MEQKTKSFLLGSAAGIALLLAAIIGFIAYLYHEGSGIRAEKSALQQKAVAEQMQRFGSTCSNAIPEAMAYLYRALAPALNALQAGNFDKEQLPALTMAVKNQEDFLRHCAGQDVSLQDERSLKRSMQLMSASSELSVVYANLRTMRVSECDHVCQQDLVRRATEASLKFESVLRGNQS